MTILFMGGEMGSFIPSDASANEATAALGGAGDSYDTAFTRCYAAGNGSTSYIESWEWAGQTDLWVHLELDQSAPTNDATVAPLLVLMDSSGNEKIRLACSINITTGIGTWALQLNNGGWATIGSTFDAAVTQKQVVDIHITCNSATGVADLYLAGTKRISNPSVDLSTVTNIAQLRGYGRTTVFSAIQAYSQVIVATTSTIGMRLMTFYASGTGATDQWTGTHASIDEAVYGDADFIWSATPNEVELFAGTLVGSLTGYSVAAVGVSARAKTDGTGPENLQLAVRTGGTTYFSSSIPLDAGYTANLAIWEDNPNTTIDWAVADIPTLQFGVKSIA